MSKYLYSYKFYCQVLCLSILYFSFGKLSFLFLHASKIVILGLFPSEGIALAFVLYFGKRVWPGIFIGQFFLAYSNDLGAITSFEIASINSIEAILAAVILSKLKFDISLKTFKDIGTLFALILFVLQPISAIFSNLALLFHDYVQMSEFINSIFSWWFGNSIGQILVTPFLLSLFLNYKDIKLSKYIAYGIVSSIILYILFIYLAINNPFLLLGLTIPIALFVVSKEGIAYGTMLSAVVGMLSSYSIYIGIGAFYIGSDIDNVINYNLFVLAHVLIVLTVSVLLEERKKYVFKLKDIINKEVSKNKEQQLMMLQQSRFAQMGEMISMIAHQWRQPLNNLSLVNQLLISKYNKNKLDSNAMEYFKVNSKKQIDLMSSTIDDFRDFFNDEKDKYSFLINEVIENMLDMTNVIYINKGIHIHINAEDTYSMVGYPNALSQAILNIINNAKDALIESDVEVKEIYIDIYEENQKIVISIKDNAGGIPANIIDKIFDPYFSTKKDKNGTGLGLYMSKMIITEKMDAFIEVFNDDKGANFKIYLDKDGNEDD